MRFKLLNGPRGGRARWCGTVALSANAATPVHEASSWLLLNLSGAVADRLENDPACAGVMSTPAALGQAAAPQSVLLTDAQIDQVAGLISLRDGGPIDLYATPSVFEDFTSTMPVLPELQRHCGVQWHMVPVAGDRRSADFQVRGQEGLAFTAFDASPAPAGCVGHPGSELPGHCIAVGVRERASGRRALFARGLGAMVLSSLGVLDDVDCLLVDAGTAAGHSVAEELLDWMAGLPLPRKVLLGVAPSEAGLVRRGIEAGVDGAEIVV